MHGRQEWEQSVSDKSGDIIHQNLGNRVRVAQVFD